MDRRYQRCLTGWSFFGGFMALTPRRGRRGAAQPSSLVVALTGQDHVRMGSLPSGTVTFLFTDVEGSTRLLNEWGAEVYARRSRCIGA